MTPSILKSSCGSNPALNEWFEDHKWIPEVAARDGAQTTYPDFRLTLNPATAASFKPMNLSKSAVDVRKAVAAGWNPTPCSQGGAKYGFKMDHGTWTIVHVPF